MFWMGLLIFFINIDLWVLHVDFCEFQTRDLREIILTLWGSIQLWIYVQLLVGSHIYLTSPFSIVYHRTSFSDLNQDIFVPCCTYRQFYFSEFLRNNAFNYYCLTSDLTLCCTKAFDSPVVPAVRLQYLALRSSSIKSHWQLVYAYL